MKKFLVLVLIWISDLFCAQDIVTCGVKDTNGDLWFSVTGRGIYRYDGKAFYHHGEKEKLPGFINCIYEDRSGGMWFGTDDGVYQYHGKAYVRFPLPEADSSSMVNFSVRRTPRQVNTILEDGQGNFWFVTLHHGVYRYDPRQKDSTDDCSAFTHFLGGEVLLCMAEDRNGDILVGSWRHGGVYRYTGKTFTALSGFSDDMIFCMLKDRAGNVWVGTRDNGVDRWDGKSIVNFNAQHGLTNANVSCLFEDSKGNIWLGSDARQGIQRGDAFCYDGKAFTNVTAGATLASHEGGYSVRSIAEDKDGYIWIGSRNGLLLRYDPRLGGSPEQRNTFIDFSGDLRK